MGPIPEPSCPNRQLRKAALRSHRSDPIPTGRRRTARSPTAAEPRRDGMPQGQVRSRNSTRRYFGCTDMAAQSLDQSRLQGTRRRARGCTVTCRASTVTHYSELEAECQPLLPWMRCYQCGPASAVKPRCRSRLAQRAKREIACVRGQIRARHSPRQMPQRVHDDVSRIVLAAQRCD